MSYTSYEFLLSYFIITHIIYIRRCLVWSISTYLFRLRRWCWSCVTEAPRSRTAFPSTRSCPESGSAWGWRRGAGTATWTTCLQAEPYRRPASRTPHRLISNYCTARAAVKLRPPQHSCGTRRRLYCYYYYAGHVRDPLWSGAVRTVRQRGEFSICNECILPLWRLSKYYFSIER